MRDERPYIQADLCLEAVPYAGSDIEIKGSFKQNEQMFAKINEM